MTAGAEPRRLDVAVPLEDRLAGVPDRGEVGRVVAPFGHSSLIEDGNAAPLREQQQDEEGRQACQPPKSCIARNASDKEYGAKEPLELGRTTAEEHFAHGDGPGLCTGPPADWRDRNLFELPPREWLDARVDYTILGGRIVYDRSRDE